MVRRKPSRAVTSKVKKDSKVTNENDEEIKLNHQKRLDGFDMRVKEVVEKMEAEKKRIISSIEHLYFLDEQRTSPEVNKMLWVEFLKLNTPSAASTKIRRSVAEIAELAESTGINTPLVRRGKKPGKIVESVSTTTRALRSRSKATPLAQIQDTPVLSKTASKKYRDHSDMVTPQNQRILVPSSIITPKFDPKTPLVPSTIRKPKLGEIMVSFEGSPVQVDPLEKISLRDMEEDELDAKSKEELKTLQERIAHLLNQN